MGRWRMDATLLGFFLTIDPSCMWVWSKGRAVLRVNDWEVSKVLLRGRGQAVIRAPGEVVKAGLKWVIAVVNAADCDLWHQWSLSGLVRRGDFLRFSLKHPPLFARWQIGVTHAGFVWLLVKVRFIHGGRFCHGKINGGFSLEGYGWSVSNEGTPSTQLLEDHVISISHQRLWPLSWPTSPSEGNAYAILHNRASLVFTIN